MEVNRKNLRDILAYLRPGLGRKEIITQIGHFMFFPDSIVSFNDRICISYPFNNTEGFFSIKGEEFFRLIDGINEETITITLKDNKITTKAKGTKSVMSTIAEDQNILPKDIETIRKGQKSWRPLPSNFTEGLYLCSFSASPDLTKGIMACVGVIDGACYATDGSRMSAFILNGILEEPLYIAASTAAVLSNFPVVEYCTDGNWGHFRTKDRLIFSSLLMWGELPIDQMIEIFNHLQDLPHFPVPSELKYAVDNVVVLADEVTGTRGKAVTIFFREGEITVKAENEIGWVEKSFSCKYSGVSIKTRINSRFLSQILGKAATCCYDKNRMHFENKDFQHVFLSCASLLISRI